MNYKTQQIREERTVKNIYFVGIKGVGVAPLALIAKQAGMNVAGSDISEVFITDACLEKEGVEVSDGFSLDNIETFFEGKNKSECLVVTTGAHKGFDNAQSLWAKQHGIEVLTQGQALGVFMEGDIFERSFKGVAVAGSHGKTTISALLATTLSALGEDTTYSIGTGAIFPLGNPGHFGSGDFFVAEADEYASEPIYDKVPKFLYLKPKYAIFNNIDFDHPDMFADIKDIKKAFFQLAYNIQSGGTLFLNGDDLRLLELKSEIQKDIRVITYGQKAHNDYVISKIVSEKSSSRFTVSKKGKELGVFEVNVNGVHNAINGLSVISFLTEIGFDSQKIREALSAFKGSKRRMEILGKTQDGALVIDDYAHHPLEISTTLEAIAKAYPEKKITAIFQPHTYSRTKSLLSEFAASFGGADKLILLPVFKSQRDSEKDVISKDEYVMAFQGKIEAIFIENFHDVVKYVMKNLSKDENIILTVGAGDVYKIGYSLVQKV